MAIQYGPYSVSAGSSWTETYIQWSCSDPISKISVKFKSSKSTYSFYAKYSNNGSYTALIPSIVNGSCTMLQYVTLELDSDKKYRSGKTSGSFFICFKNGSYSNIYVTFETESSYKPSTYDVNVVNVGDPQTIRFYNDDIASLKHTVKWLYTGQDGTTYTEETTTNIGATSFSWDTPSTSAAIENLYRSSATSTITGSVTVKTINGATGAQIGNSSQSDIYMTIPETSGTKPTLTVSSTHSGTAIIQSQTTVQLSITANAQYGASIANVKITSPDYVYNGVSTTGHSFVPQTSGSQSISVTVTDSRGYSTTASTGFEVVPCSPPRFTYSSAERCRQDGTVDDEGEYIVVTASANATLNSSSVSLTYSASIKTSDGQPMTITKISETTSQRYTAVYSTDDGFSAEQSYTVTITASPPSDSGLNPVSTQCYVGVAIYTIYRMVGGKGVAFGTAASKIGVEVNEAWPLYTHGQEIMELMVDVAHPVGSVIESLNDTFNPNVSWPWTQWTLLKDRFLYGAGTKSIYSTGGSESATVDVETTISDSITIKPQNLPIYSVFAAKTSSTDTVGYDTSNLPSGFPSRATRDHSGNAGYKYIVTRANALPIEITGSSSASDTIDTMPPYIAVNIWTRIQ